MQIGSTWQIIAPVVPVQKTDSHWLELVQVAPSGCRPLQIFVALSQKLP